MPFAAELHESMQGRGREFPSEFIRGDSLEHVLNRYLLAIEQMGIGDIVTSVLLLSPDGKRLSHAAAPNLPQAYRHAIDGCVIGPRAGSCGTAAYFGRPVYVTDIASDPLWADYRHLALPHGLMACWSTPIRDDAGAVIGTFAIYHRDVGAPTPDEIEAIAVITEHVARAIMWATSSDPSAAPSPYLTVVEGGDAEDDGFSHRSDRLLLSLERLESLAAELESHAEKAESEESRNMLKSAAADSRKLVATVRQHVDPNRSADE